LKGGADENLIDVWPVKGVRDFGGERKKKWRARERLTKRKK